MRQVSEARLNNAANYGPAAGGGSGFGELWSGEAGCPARRRAAGG